MNPSTAFTTVFADDLPRRGARAIAGDRGRYRAMGAARYLDETPGAGRPGGILAADRGAAR